MTGKLLAEDIDLIARSIPDPEKLRGASVLVTGASGLIGSIAVRSLVAADRLFGLGLTIYALARDRQRLERAAGPETGTLRFAVSPVEADPLPCPPADYVLHCAAPTASDYFCKKPVETAGTILHGTENILKQVLRDGRTKKIVFLSSIEVYGRITEKIRVTEACQGPIDPLNVRSSYPMAKRMAECLCKSYCEEYRVPVVIARLTQTFGPGIAASDNRVFVQFAKSVMTGSDIVLHTDGRSAKPYIYTTDAITALFYLLLRGESGTAYNVANEATFCTVREMAELVSRLGEKPVSVSFDKGKGGIYPPDSFLDLDCSRLRALGWRPEKGLETMYRRLMGYIAETEAMTKTETMAATAAETGKSNSL